MGQQRQTHDHVSHQFMTTYLTDDQRPIDQSPHWWMRRNIM